MMIRGYEPYGDEGEFNSKDGSKVEKLQLMDFPSLGEEPLDKIVDKCWRGGYKSIRELAKETSNLRRAAQLPRATLLSEEVYKKRHEECLQLVNNEILNEVPLIQQTRR